MERPQPFKRLSKGRCYVQTAVDRFGDEAPKAIRSRELAVFGHPPETNEPPFNWPGPNADTEPETGQDDHKSIYEIVPSMQKYRNNLTALSQVYNLYFVAYQGRIFVYRPRGFPAQALPQLPDLQLAPAQSNIALAIGGYVDEANPHLINHLVTGHLGQHEIVVACYDDGDVVAYYVKDVAMRIEGTADETTSLIGTPPQEFFHDNVGHTAWGLAVHQKSRLIAVSSNRHEVTVFAFGLSSKHPRKKEATSMGTYVYHDANVRKRARNWRIVITLGLDCDNIPNISIMDAPDGTAEKVCAIDIRGAIWLAEIWKRYHPPIYIPPLPVPMIMSEENAHSMSRGWGVFALQSYNFMPVQTYEELVGIPQNQCSPRPTPESNPDFINISAGLNNIPGNPRPPQPRPPSLGINRVVMVGEAAELMWQAAVQEHPSDEETDETSDEEEHEEEHAEEVGGELEELEQQFEQGFEELDEEALGNQEITLDYIDNIFLDAFSTHHDLPVTTNYANREFKFSNSMQVFYEDSASDPYPDHLDMTYFPHMGAVAEAPRKFEDLLDFLRLPHMHNKIPRRDRENLRQIGDRLLLLRTYEKDIELRPCHPQWPDRSACQVGVFCSDALTLGPQTPALRHQFGATSRLSMIAHMPELSAMAIGSSIGRVLLITLTKKLVTASASASYSRPAFQHGFRTEWVLPTIDDEKKHRKVVRPLHGIAVSPVPRAMGSSSVAARLPPRYRLMLHYRTHDIFSYEITRDEESGKLCIF